MNKRKQQTLPRILSAVLTAVMLCALTVPSLAVTQEQIDAKKEEAEGIAEQKAQKAVEVESLITELTATLEKKARLDADIEALEGEIAALEEQILTLEDEIAVKEAELEEAQAREAEKYALFCERVRAMEEQGRMDYWLILFRASSFSDLLSRLDFVSEIMDADQRVIDDLKAVQAEIQAVEEDLEEKKSAAETARTEQMAKQADLDAQREEANQLIQSLEDSKSQAEADLDDLSQEEEAVQEEIVRLSFQMAAEQAEAEARRRAEEEAQQYLDSIGGLTTAATSGGYIWPVNSRRINSTFGGRASPGGIGSTNHKGVDIGGVGYGTAVHASKAGQVIISQYSSSYGNYVAVSHGSGNTTLYAHLSSRSVSVGQYVEQGDLLGTTGSTGRSTGPHLHFEITENGVRINPLNYLGGYYLAR